METGTSGIEAATNTGASVLNTGVLSEVKEVFKPKEDDLIVGIEGNSESKEDGGLLVERVIKEEPVEVVQPEQLVPDVTLFNQDVQHGYRIFCELLSDQYKVVTKPFLEPVDAEELGLYDYHTRIETPMSFRQIDMKFKNYLYQTITEVISDLRLILENCYRYNGSGHWISKLAQKLENILEQKLALLNRSLREKVSLQATMAFRSNKTLVTDDAEDSGGRRRRSGRCSYSSGHSNEQASRLVNRLILEEEETQKELKKVREKEKKEANEALMQELAEWENEFFVGDVVKELQSIWEVPSVGSFLWLFQEPLNLSELNYTEFENGLLLPHKSRLMACIFTSLLATPNQRKSVHKKPPMKFSTWQKKLKEKVDLWYITREAEQFHLVPHTTGPDAEFYEILGESNPLEQKLFMDLSLHQRVLILKSLCDECLDYDYQFRDYLGNADSSPFREVVLGHDGSNFSYVYFPIFDATDVRVYKQAALPSSAEWYRKWKSNKSSGRYMKQQTTSAGSSSGINQSRSRKSASGSGINQSRSRKSPSSSSWTRSTSIQEGFELVCHDVDGLRELCERFSDATTTPSGKKRRGRPPRKHCEKLLHQSLVGLLEELEVSEAKYGRARTKGMLNLMKDWKTVEEPAEADDESCIVPSENQVEDNEVTNSDPSSSHTIIHSNPTLSTTSILEVHTSSTVTSLPANDATISVVTRSRRGNPSSRNDEPNVEVAMQANGPVVITHDVTPVETKPVLSSRTSGFSEESVGVQQKDWEPVLIKQEKVGLVGTCVDNDMDSCGAGGTSVETGSKSPTTDSEDSTGTLEKSKTSADACGIRNSDGCVRIKREFDSENGDANSAETGNNVDMRDIQDDSKNENRDTSDGTGTNMDTRDIQGHSEDILVVNQNGVIKVVCNGDSRESAHRRIKWSADNRVVADNFNPSGSVDTSHQPPALKTMSENGANHAVPETSHQSPTKRPNADNDRSDAVVKRETSH